MLQGVLVDLVPHTTPFDSHEKEWMLGPMREWWGLDGLTTEAFVQQRREIRQAEIDAGHLVRFGVMTKEAVPIGTFILRGVSPYHRTAEVGAGIGDPAYWGRGYGSDAMLLIVEYAFEWLDLRRLWLTTRGDNVRAQRQVERCGFKQEGTRRLTVRDSRGQWVDLVTYGLLREEWPGRESMVQRLKLREKTNDHRQGG